MTTTTTAIRKWTKPEEKKLLEALGQGKEYEAIAGELGRSVGAVNIRARKMASDLIAQGEPAEEVYNNFKLTPDDLEKHKEIADKQKAKKSTPKVTTAESSNDKLAKVKTVLSELLAVL